jgi:hypothetical protein
MLTNDQAKPTLTLQHLKARSLSNLGPLHQQTYCSFAEYAKNHRCNSPIMLAAVAFRDDIAERFGVDGVVVFLTERSWSNLLYLDRAVFKCCPDVHIVNATLCDSFDISRCSISCIKFC